MKIAVLTLGCRTNQAESSNIQQSLQAIGHETVDSASDAEICIINTCSVTSSADYQSRQLISRAIKAGAKVIVTGCYSELNTQSLADNRSNVKIIPNADKGNIISLIPANSSQLASTAYNISRHRPIVKVQDGCNNECSYCIIPRARGRSVSVDPHKVLDEVAHYHQLGFEEIVLSGIHLGIYGRDFSPELNLAKLLKLLLVKTNAMRLRLSSIEIGEVSDELLEVLHDCRICRHLHLPLQSGDDAILKIMNRTYESSDYVRAFRNISNRFDNMALGTDIIAGFPGEDYDRFMNTVKLCDSLPFSYLHVFPYSSRPGTRASLLKEQLPSSEKKLRVSQLRAISSRQRVAFIEKNIGYEHEMLVESQSKDVITGTTSNFIRVRVLRDPSLSAGSLVRVRITGIEGEMALGFPITNVKPIDK